MQTNKVGCLVGTLNEEDQIVIGWSACNRKAGDEFSRIRGIEVALSAATATINKDEIEAMPHRIRKAMPQFIERCERYFRRPVNRE